MRFWLLRSEIENDNEWIKGEPKTDSAKFSEQEFSWNERTRTFEAAKKKDPSIMPD
jgi:hypothetical protein